jgi:hypothetical protein
LALRHNATIQEYQEKAVLGMFRIPDGGFRTTNNNTTF